MWTKQQLKNWIAAHTIQRLAENTDNITTYVMTDGSRYTFVWTFYTVNKKEYDIRINGITIFHGITD